VSVDVQVEVVIDSPVVEVASFAGDSGSAPQWYANIASVSWQTAPPVSVGSRMDFVVHLLGRTLAYTHEVVELKPNRRLVMRTADGPFPMETTYTWHQADVGGTRMTLRNPGHAGRIRQADSADDGAGDAPRDDQGPQQAQGPARYRPRTLIVAYDEDLAGRTRELLAELTDFEERKMFGGLAFMVNTHMACGIVHDDLMVRVGKDNHNAAINAGATEMDFTGRPMRGMVIVPANRLRGDSDLEPWVVAAVEFARSDPPKKPRR